MAWLLIKNNIVVNSIVPPTGEWTPPDGEILVQADGNIGDVWDGVRCTPTVTYPSADDVTAERNRRIEAGFEFQGKLYQSTVADRENIAGAAQAAMLAKMAGVSGDKTDWQVEGTPFVWIAADNSLTIMDPDTLIAFAKTALAAKQGLIFSAFELKARNPIPTDYVEDIYWSTAAGA